MRETIVFDVNETLLDLRALGPWFVEAFGSDELLAPWFARMLRNSLIATITDGYRRFDDLGVDALVTTAREAGFDMDRSTAVDVVDGMRSLPAHPDVAPALEILTDAGFVLATLTNSAGDVITDQLRNAGIADVFSEVISVDEVGVFKPHPATYRHAAERLGVPIAAIRLVAAHDWDVLGARRAGARAAYVNRSGGVDLDDEPAPDIVGTDLGEVARAIIATEATG